MENVINRDDVKLVSNKKKILFKMDIKTKLYDRKTTRQWFSCNT